MPFSPNTGKKSSNIKSSCKREYININCDIVFDFAGSSIHDSFIFNYDNWFNKYQMTSDSAKSKVTRNNFTGLVTSSYTLMSKMGQNLEDEFIRKVCEEICISIKPRWTSGTSCICFGIVITASISAKSTTID